MDAFDVTILGCSSALPAFGRYPSSQLIHIAGRYFLVDCGEGAQMQLRRFGLKFQRISHIFISHLHGDHYLGLPGLLSSMHLLGRKEPLNLYAPEGLKEILKVNHEHSHSFLQFPLNFYAHDFSEPKLIFEDEKLTVRTIILKHSIPCCGFVFEEKEKPRKIIIEKIAEYKVPVLHIESLKWGSDFITADSKIIRNSELTADPPPPKKYAYCSDTSYNEALIPAIKDADLIYHEATFMEALKDRAYETKHSTAADAAGIAKAANVKKMIIGHFSARYKELQPLLNEAKAIFPNTFLANEGEKVLI